ncbi:polysaccharide biosynthesis protein [Enterococcus sp. JM4C]|uniref:oligosaccharide flippase family protein n=1 Tax=Candidatus Enterococcus huntleyi TaxID=1857217 RepID=UPI00137B1321|nr:oligosaccharide flippase family protein [Enterococcus sp. JM4C]KAF1298819.1 polysaccharide biosynthesis protein [Enterococcus sp. JM4C]
MNKYKKLLNNSIVFAIGNLGTKLIAILLVPLYTFYLTPDEYGITDLITTTTNLMLPIVSLSIFDAVLRFVMDKDEDKESVLTNGILVSVIGTVISIGIYPIMFSFIKDHQLVICLYVLLFFQIFFTIFSQFARGIGKVKVFAVSGILVAFFLFLCNLFFIVYLGLGILGYILSMIFSTAVGIVYLLISINLFSYVKLDKINKELIKRMLMYSMPLIPNALMWWITNASGRFFILYYLGLSANGLYAVANKFPSLLSILYSIFSQAWQLSAIEEFDSEESNTFYSTIFNLFTFVMFTGASLFLILLKPLLTIVVESNYYVTWQYIPYLLLGVIFSSFSSFIAANYIAAKQTKGVFTTSIYGAVINVVGNFILIPLLGLTGASLSLLISFFVTWIIRVYDTRKFVNLQLNKLNIFLNLICLSVQIFVLNLRLSLGYEMLINLIVFLVICIVNRVYFKTFFHKISLKKR